MDFTQQIKEAKSEKEKYDLFISNPFTPVDYPSFQSMLESQRPDMYKKFDQLLKQADKTAGSLQIRSEEAGLPDFIFHVTDTSIYGPSRRLRAFQYLTEQNIIRIWDKDLIALMREDLKTQEEYLLADSGAENHKD